LPLLNYRTRVPAERTAQEIQAKLGKAGATAVMMQYDQGVVTGLAFRIVPPHGTLPYMLPVRVEEVEKIFRKQRISTGTDNGQPRMTAWRILKDWIEAQLALIETGMVATDEVFLPYLQSGEGESFYDRVLKSGYRLALPAPGDEPFAIVGPQE